MPLTLFPPDRTTSQRKPLRSMKQRVFVNDRISMEALEIKREVEMLSDRLGKAQDYL
ncbi:MAG TPA: hypothetical protein V6C64_02380 [Microcoleaceae cyanobacterium]|jgi:hypothetical protein